MRKSKHGKTRNQTAIPISDPNMALIPLHLTNQRIIRMLEYIRRKELEKTGKFNPDILQNKLGEEKNKETEEGQEFMKQFEDLEKLGFKPRSGIVYVKENLGIKRNHKYNQQKLDMKRKIFEEKVSGQTRQSVNADLERELKRMFKEQKEGIDHLSELNKRREYSNPDIVEVAQKNWDINEIGSNCPKSLFNPKSTVQSKLDFYDAIADKQTEFMRKQHEEIAKKMVTSVQTNVATANNTTGLVDLPKKRHWDSQHKENLNTYKNIYQAYYIPPQNRYEVFLESKKKMAKMSKMLDDDDMV